MLETHRLKQLLASSARWHSRTAVSKFSSSDLNDQLQAAISVGTASELLLKALLFQSSPALLVDKGHTNSLLLLGEVVVDDLDALDFRSMAAREVHVLAKRLHPRLPTLMKKEIEPLRARNAAAHLALVENQQLHDALREHVRLVEAVLPILELDSAPYWTEHLHASVLTLVDEARSAVEQVVLAKIAAAGMALEVRTRSLSVDARTSFFAALSGIKRSSADYDGSQECPACSQRGWLLCFIERGELEYDEAPLVRRSAYPFAFECPVCELELENEELLEVEGFPQEIELEPDFDPEEFYNFEPDEDFIRGR